MRDSESVSLFDTFALFVAWGLCWGVFHRLSQSLFRRRILVGGLDVEHVVYFDWKQSLVSPFQWFVFEQCCLKCYYGGCHLFSFAISPIILPQPNSGITAWISQRVFLSICIGRFIFGVNSCTSDNDGRRASARSQVAQYWIEHPQSYSKPEDIFLT